MKYNILLNIVDKICQEAPQSFKSYHPKKGNQESINQARSKAFIHLFLKIKYGVSDFSERHEFITDGSQDGGVDAYYIDNENKKFILIQSKFGVTENTFEEKSISANDLITMEIDRILSGEECDSKGVRFSTKILKLQSEWSKLEDQARYKVNVIILGNITRYSKEQIKRIIGNFQHEVFNFERTYSELVFPLCSGTYYDPKEIKITIDLVNKEQPTLRQEIRTKLGNFAVRVLFIPTKEIGRIMSKYKNSILKYNPRNYLSFSKNSVNRKIKESIEKDSFNDFALYNNGITIIAKSCEISEKTGTKNVGQLILSAPQVINGGQTAYVLSTIFEEQARKNKDYKVFGGKEVMLKVIVLTGDEQNNLDFIEQISNATNQQTKVEEADRRSNDKIQIEVEEKMFKIFGYFYERKSGEFFNGIDKKYINKNYIINRADFLRSCLAWSGNASDARRSSTEALFKEGKFAQIINHLENFEELFFAYKVFKNIPTINKKSKTLFGPSMKGGKMAILSAVSYITDFKKIDKNNIDLAAQKNLEKLANIWGKFVKYVFKQKKRNKAYFLDKNTIEYDKYYKGSTLNEDIKKFFKPLKNKN